MARLCVLLALALLFPAARSTLAQSANVLPNGGFEAGADGWTAPTGAALVVDGSAPVQAGAAAGHVTASAAGTIRLATQY